MNVPLDIVRRDLAGKLRCLRIKIIATRLQLAFHGVSMSLFAEGSTLVKFTARQTKVMDAA